MKKKRTKRGLWLCIILLLAAAAYAVYDSAFSLSVSSYEINSAKLPESFEGFRIVQLSDLHGRSFGEDNDKLVAAVAAERPDIIALTGDIITEAEDIAVVERLAGRLTEICDVYFVSGNHDYGSGAESELARVLEENGVRYLRNEYLLLERGGESIVLAGVEDPNSWADMIRPDELCTAVRGEYPDSFVLLLGHRNYWLEEYPQIPVDLILCGHNHGGIVRLPGVGGLLGTDRTLFPEYDCGLFESENYSMIVSAGLGNSVPIPRVFNRPEIVSVTLHSGGQN